MTMPAQAVTAERASFGTLPDSRVVEAVTLDNGEGVSATIISLGAALQSVVLAGRDGVCVDVAPGHETVAGYLEQPQYFGATVGRFANRIAKGKFSLDGNTYRVPVNNGANALHGGPAGLDKSLWTIESIEQGECARAVLKTISPAGDQGFPGALTVLAIYTLDARGTLGIEYRATTDAATIVNITNHAYWNLAGDAAATGAMGHLLTIPAEAYLPTDAGLIPTGEIESVAGTPFDFRTPAMIGARVRDGRDSQIVAAKGYDHNFVTARDVSAQLRLNARLVDPASGRGFELWSNQPGLQFYSGNFLDATVKGKRGTRYRQGDAIALEPQLFPDTPNHPAFGSARLDPGETYLNRIEYRFFVEGGPE